ncbi:MAG: hypothetical protein R6W76_14395 [Caldilinea sp.]
MILWLGGGDAWGLQRMQTVNGFDPLAGSDLLGGQVLGDLDIAQDRANPARLMLA